VSALREKLGGKVGPCNRGCKESYIRSSSNPHRTYTFRHFDCMVQRCSSAQDVCELSDPDHMPSDRPGKYIFPVITGRLSLGIYPDTLTMGRPPARICCTSCSPPRARSVATSRTTRILDPAILTASFYIRTRNLLSKEGCKDRKTKSNDSSNSYVGVKSVIDSSTPCESK